MSYLCIHLETRAKRKTGRKRSNTTVADFQYLGLPTLHDDQNTTAFSRLVSVVVKQKCLHILLVAYTVTPVPATPQAMGTLF